MAKRTHPIHHFSDHRRAYKFPAEFGNSATFSFRTTHPLPPYFQLTVYACGFLHLLLWHDDYHTKSTTRDGSRVC